MKLVANEETVFLITGEIGDVTPGSEEGPYQDDSRFRLRATVIVQGEAVTLEARRAGGRVELGSVLDPHGRLASIDLSR